MAIQPAAASSSAGKSKSISMSRPEGREWCSPLYALAPETIHSISSFETALITGDGGGTRLASRPFERGHVANTFASLSKVASISGALQCADGMPESSLSEYLEKILDFFIRTAILRLMRRVMASPGRDAN